ncbi:MAG TPA: hypothetical protein VFE50_09005 [Cyclobacteriaceae bacterium]|nr:hypothetical protein [Cyclobacteriaceae bacterium]
MIRFVIFISISMVWLPAFGQKSSDNIVKKYAEFRKQFPGVRVDLDFNQERYSPGDTVWFKAYFLNSDGSKVKGRQLLDLSVVSSDAGVLQHFLFGVNDGIGYNQFVFPEGTLPGIYAVAVYSSWMLNFEPVPVFSKDLIVVREKEVYAEQKPGHKSSEILNSLPVIDDKEVVLSFRAKEGSMVRYQDLYFIQTQNDKIVAIKPFRIGVKSSETIRYNYVPGFVENSVIDKLGRVIANWGDNLPALEVRDVDPFKVTIEAGGSGFKARKKTNLLITIVDHDNRPVEGEFSVSVLNHDKQNKTQASLATSEHTAGEPWGQILSGRRMDTRYTFTTDLFRTGTAFYPDGTPLPGGTPIAFYLQYNDVILQATTLPGGKFTLPLRDITNADEMLAFAEVLGQSINGIKVVWNQKSITLPSPPPSREGDQEDAFGVFASTKKLIDKAFMFYGTMGSREPASAADARNVSALEERINGGDNSVDVQKYVSFQTMNELIREVVPSLQSRTIRGKPLVQVALREPMAIASADPLYIIDGTVTRDTEFFLAIKPSDVAMIRVVTNPGKLLPLGLIGKNGIVMVETFKGNARPPFQEWQKVEGINPALTFKQRNYKESDAHKPDIRSTIFWAPTVATDANGKAQVEFVHSDDTGTVVVVVKGRTKDGNEFKQEKTFQATLK